MKTLHELAIEYAKSIYQEEYDDPTFVPDVFQTKNDFAAGYRAAFEWISVEDELPKKGKWILVRINESYHTMCIKGDSDMKFFLANVIVWRPINND